MDLSLAILICAIIFSAGQGLVSYNCHRNEYPQNFNLLVIAIILWCVYFYIRG